jgi:hypothetical protein
MGGGALVVFLKTGSEAILASILPISLACNMGEFSEAIRAASFGFEPR